MPKTTFFNLPEEKKQKILDVAIDEFYRQTYQTASINRIVEKAGIAKGSFYQYFEDKKDLFMFILDKSGEEKLKYINNVIKNINSLDFFSFLKEMYIAGINFAKNNPKLSKITIDFLKNGDSRLKEEVLNDSTLKSNKMFEELLLKGIKEGDINPDIDVSLVAYMITNLNLAISEYFIREQNIEDDQVLISLVDKMLDVLKNGIKKRWD